MSARIALIAALALMGCSSEASTAAPPAAPAPDGKALAEACAGHEGWSDPAPPAKIFGNSYYVGTCGITAILIDTPGGLVLIDGATEEAAPSILANIRALGFDPRNVNFLLSSHEHFDHVGGLKALQDTTGGRVFVRAEAAAAMASGEPQATDPQRGILKPFAGVRISRTVLDGEVLKIPGVRITAHATPAHTPGSTSWTWKSCEGSNCRTIAYIDSLSAVSADDYRFRDHPEYVATFRATLAKVSTLRCDILLTPHPGASNMFDRLAGKAPLADANGCKTYAEGAAKRLDGRLARENAAK